MLNVKILKNKCLLGNFLWIYNINLSINKDKIGFRYFELILYHITENLYLFFIEFGFNMKWNFILRFYLVIVKVFKRINWGFLFGMYSQLSKRWGG